MLETFDIEGRRSALVHDWLTGMRGGEKCLEVLCELSPQSDLFTLLHNPGTVAPVIERRRIVTSFIQRLPFAATGYRRYLPLFPSAIERLDLSRYDLVISSSNCVAKGVRVSPAALHICYCHTPMRYIWDQYDAYFGAGRAAWPTRLAAGLFRRPLQRWDVGTASRVHHFVANSRFVAARIQRYYGRRADVIYPPVETSRFQPSFEAPDDYFLVVSALNGYKRVDLAVEVALATGARLKIVGRGPDEEHLRKLAAGGRIEFLGWVPEPELADLYRHTRALLFPGEEDFGIAPLECMASGRPVLALARGGALETVKPEHTGMLIESTRTADWVRALGSFRDAAFNPEDLRRHAERFDRKRYSREMADFIRHKWQAHAGTSVPG